MGESNNQYPDTISCDTILTLGTSFTIHCVVLLKRRYFKGADASIQGTRCSLNGLSSTKM